MDNFHADTNNSCITSGKIDVSPSKNEKKRIRKLYNGVGGAMLAQYFLMYIIVLVCYILFSGSITEEYNEETGAAVVGFTEAAIMFCSPAAASIIMFFVYNGICHADIKSLLSTDKVNGMYILGAVLVAFFFHQIGMILEYGLAIVLTVVGYDTPELNIELMNDLPTTVIDIFSSVILAPIGEELFFRGVVLRQTSRVSQRFGIFFSAFVFGIMHGNPYQFILASLLGLVLGYIAVDSNSLIPPIICHMAVNLMASVSDIAAYFDEALYEPVFYICSLIELVVGIVGFIYIKRNVGIKLPSYTEYHKKRTMPIMITSALVVIMVVIYSYDLITSIEPIDVTNADYTEAMKYLICNLH